VKENPMKQEAFTHLEVKKDDKVYTFSMPMGASLADAVDAAFMCFKAIDQAFRTTIDKEKEEFEAKSNESQKVSLKDAASDTVEE